MFFVTYNFTLFLLSFVIYVLANDSYQNAHIKCLPFHKKSKQNQIVENEQWQISRLKAVLYVIFHFNHLFFCRQIFHDNQTFLLNGNLMDYLMDYLMGLNKIIPA